MERWAASSSGHLGALFVGLALVSSPVFAQRSASPTVTLLTSMIDLGKIAPSAPAVAASSQGNAVVRVTSDRYWQLAMVRDPDSVGDEIALSSDGAVWTISNPGLLVPLATGTATPPEGFLVNARLRVTPTFDMHPGRRQYSFSLMLNGQRVDPPVRLNFEISPTVTFEEDNGRFAVTADRPSERRDYDFNPRTYIVRSNVPWVLEIAPQTSSPAPYTVEALDEDGSLKPLTHLIIVARGQATGRSGASIPVRLRLKLAEVAEAGAYSTNIDVRARIVTPLDKVVSKGEIRK